MKQLTPSEHYIDLHVHSNYSDGSCSPEELVHIALSQKLSAFALTDHDTVDGVPKAMEEARRLANNGQEILVIPGVEISAGYKKRDIHILGLILDYKNPELLSVLRDTQENREQRNQEMLSRFQKAGIPMTEEEIRRYTPTGTITRAHFARALVELGIVKNTSEAFHKYLGYNCPYYVPREYLSPAAAIRLILEAGGVPVLAHPLLYQLEKSEVEELVDTLIPLGLRGLEAIYSANSRQDEQYVRSLANRRGLLISGGSDFHGTNKPHLSMGTGRGNLKIPEALLESLMGN